MNSPFKEYIGDSVYADYDGYHIILTTENGYAPSNTIALEPNVLEALSRYQEWLAREAGRTAQRAFGRSNRTTPTTMKVWELMAQLQGRDPSGEVMLTLSGDGFKYVACFDLSPPANRKVVIEADPEDIGVDVNAHQQEIDQLCNQIDDLNSACQRLVDTQLEHERNNTPDTLATMHEAQLDALDIIRRLKAPEVYDYGR